MIAFMRGLQGLGPANRVDPRKGNALFRFFALAAVLAFSAGESSGASPSPLWGQLEPGPYAVGFRQLERYDYSRPYRPARGLDGKPRAGERARPMRISIWYPAGTVPAGSKPLTFGDYVAMVAGENSFGPLTEAQIARGERTFFQFPVFREMSSEQRERLKAMPGRAFRDAPAAPGKFPLILYSLGSAALAHVTPEYLASHGYVIAQMPRIGAFSGLPADGLDARDLESKIRDMDFLLASMHDFPSADLGNVGVVGFSAGGRWGLSELMRPGDVHAMVSLDTVMLFNDATGQAWRKMPLFNPDLVRAPVLHMIRREWVPREDRELWKQIRYSDRTSMVFEDAKLDHLDFQSAGFASTLVGMRPDAARAVAAVFDAFHRYTLAFFDAHLKGDSNARAFLARSPTENGLPTSLVTAESTRALRAPITDLQLLSEIAEGGLDSAIAAFRRDWKERREPPISEQDLNLAGYTLLFGGSPPADAVRLFELNVEAHPDSANTYDSTADAYLAAGNREKALDYSRKALALLERDKSTPEERRKLIRQSIEGKITRLTRPGG
jgi:dienelactone hydrolase